MTGNLQDMVVYSCWCLNVQVFAEKVEEVPKAECPLRQDYEFVELVDQGFQFSHKSLVQRVKDGRWTVYVCVPCNLQTHAVNHESKLVVINTKMQKGRDAIDNMKRKKEFSSAFGLVLHEGRKRDDDVLLPQQTYEALQKQLVDLHETLTNYLKLEEDAMETRIRLFEEEERKKFFHLKEKAQSEKTKLISLLFHNCDGGHTTFSNEHPSTKGQVLSHFVGSKGSTVSRFRDSSPDVFSMDELEYDSEDSPAQGVGTITKKGVDVRDSLFESSEPQGDSPGEHVSTTIESQHSSGESTDEVAGLRLPAMSTSVPISMPIHSRNLRISSYLDDDTEEGSEFADIPRNMQALSESIQERDRYIFGDRPRQRVHTGDFTQVNWH
ncbi:uncharacterized protein LOC131941283 isoform X2 [Physella acuta]|uniref:uncharacterized protein LOC131941283 isoform X2 n=1 Tax=Physella acuta TaxID=109671 RepID=UPI0027DEAA73|nr:uncharacterized protein LOC131941283 isoform X2 [Physella acuta]